VNFLTSSNSSTVNRFLCSLKTRSKALMLIICKKEIGSMYCIRWRSLFYNSSQTSSRFFGCRDKIDMQGSVWSWVVWPKFSMLDFNSEALFLRKLSWFWPISNYSRSLSARVSLCLSTLFFLSRTSFLRTSSDWYSMSDNSVCLSTRLGYSCQSNMVQSALSFKFVRFRLTKFRWSVWIFASPLMTPYKLDLLLASNLLLSSCFVSQK
jgi:hypothetical protein